MGTEVSHWPVTLRMMSNNRRPALVIDAHCRKKNYAKSIVLITEKSEKIEAVIQQVMSCSISSSKK